MITRCHVCLLEFYGIIDSSLSVCMPRLASIQPFKDELVRPALFSPWEGSGNAALQPETPTMTPQGAVELQ